jgi:hypothetical protein
MFSAEEAQEVRLFLALLFPWEDDQVNLYKTVSWTFTGKDGGTAFANYAAQSLDSMVRLIETRAKRTGANVYVALGTQRTARIDAQLSADGYPKAIRQHNNIVSFKSIWLDIDVGKPGAYATTQDAFAALDDFLKVVGLPAPTMEVYSGTGGLHVYWCTVDAIPHINWAPLAKALRDAALAHGLKFDPQVTVNPAGILRVPNTWNHKKTPPAKVRLYRDAAHTFPRYGYQQLVGALAVYINSVGIQPPQGTHANAQRAKNFTDNVGEGAPPVEIEDVAVNCAAIDDILTRHGNGDAEPLWNLALYAASFTSDPHSAAHELSNGDPRYTQQGTDKKLQEKIQARAANPDAGWPTCESFAALHPACATCPLFAQKKTPFHHARRQPTVPPTGAVHSDFVAQSNDPLMPVGYWRNKDGHVFTTLYDKAGNPYTADIINYPIHDAAIDTDESAALLYNATVGGITKWRAVDVSANMTPVAAASALSHNGGLYVKAKYHQATRDFLVAWVSHLQTARRRASQSGYGWTEDGKAFAFDDKLYHATRTETVFRGKNHEPSFTAAGKLKPWQDAMQLVYGNHPLETIVASAFAAPLIDLISPASLVLSIYSQMSGVGKSTAMMLAQAVWGNPRSGMSTLADTTNSMMKKIADLKSLPIYWDELRTKDQLEKVIDIVFQVTQGKAKARLNRDTTQADARAFTTMFVVASNSGVSETVYSQTESTEAGGLRVFEIEALAVSSSSITSYTANQLIIPLQSNYGVAGSLYAEWLARNKPAVVGMVKKVADDFDSYHQFTQKERFWSMTVTSLLAGAILANHIGLTQFDIPALRDYLDEMVKLQRGELKTNEYSTMAASVDVVALLQDMLHDIRGKHLIVTESIPYIRIGKPTPVNLVDTDLSRLGNIWCQLGDKDKRVRIRVRPFREWMHDHRLNPKQIIDALKKHYIVTQSKQTMGAGVAGLDAVTRLSRSECYDLTPFTSPAPSLDSD